MYTLLWKKSAITHSFHGIGNQEKKSYKFYNSMQKVYIRACIDGMGEGIFTHLKWHTLSLLRKHCNIHVIKQIFIEYLLVSMHWAKRHSDPNEKNRDCHLGDYSLAFSKIKYWCVSACVIRFIHSVFLVFLSGIFLSRLHIPNKFLFKDNCSHVYCFVH